MKTVSRHHLKVRLREEVEAASRRILEHPEDNVEDNLRQIETYSRLLKACPPRSADTRAWAAAVVLSCLFVVSLLATVHVSNTRLLLDVRTTAAAFQLADSWDWSGSLPVLADSLRLEGLSSVDARFLNPIVTTERHDAWVKVDAGSVSLTRLRVASGGIVQIEHHADRRFLLFLRQADLAGELQFHGDVRLRIGGAGRETGRSQASLDVPESMPFARQGEGAVPVHLQATFGEDWFLKDLPVQALSVNQEVPGRPGATALVSSLREGSIILPDTSRQVTLRQRDQIVLEGVSGLLQETRLERDGIHLIFQGRADGIRLGPPGFAQNLAPTCLEYLYHNQPLALFWTAASFLAGIVWGIRRILFE